MGTKQDELQKELEYHESQLRMYRRWYQEKNDFGYFENMSFAEIKKNIENEKEKIESIKESLSEIEQDD